MAADPVVSTADTIRAAIKECDLETLQELAPKALDALAALLAVVERDRTEIERLALKVDGLRLVVAGNRQTVNTFYDDREQDRQQIARLTKAANDVLTDAELMAEGTLYHCATEPMERLMQAVLADEEDAGKASPTHTSANTALDAATLRLSDSFRRAAGEGDAPPEGYIVPEGDKRCGFTMDACTCMKRRGHDGLHACAHGGWRAAGEGDT